MKHSPWRRRIAAIMLAIWLLLQLPVGTGAAQVRYLGDVDNSGDLTTADARQIMCHVLGASILPEPDQADMNGDGSINSGDVRSVLIAVLGGRAPSVYPSVLSASQYSGEPYRVLQDNMPQFSDGEKASFESFETYAPLDSLGRCGTAYANLSTALMPDEDRESISSVTPSGWHNQSYDFVSGGWVYNRSHLIGFQLAGEQANERNLITGTRYFNTEGMLPFENMVADYIRETDHHVLYRVTPVFNGDNLLAEGVTIEAWSIEDGGQGICFYVFCYNVQPGVTFDYATGENHADSDTPPEDEPILTVTFVLNVNTKKFHLTDCRYASSMSADSREDYGGTREALIENGYSPCGTCKP